MEDGDDEGGKGSPTRFQGIRFHSFHFLQSALPLPVQLQSFVESLEEDIPRAKAAPVHLQLGNSK